MSKSVFVKRKVQLSPSGSNKLVGEILVALKATAGIRNAVYDIDKNQLSIEYDLLLTQYASILSQLVDLEVEIQKGFRFNMLSNWYDYLDGSIRENGMAPPPACCNKVPKR